MEALQTIGPLIGVVIGSLLTGAGALYKARKERKRIVAIALADLLEVRHRLSSADMFVRTIRSRVEIQADLLPKLRDLWDQLLPFDAALDDRYNKAVTMLASIDPVLGFSLRSKNMLPRVLATLRAQATSCGADMAAFEQIEAELRLVATPTLNAAVLELASAHSWLTTRKVKALIKKSQSVPPELLKLFERLPSVPQPVTPPSLLAKDGSQ